MGRRKSVCKEGDWVAIPLEGGGWGIGLIARHRQPLVIGYFFGPRRGSQPTLQEAVELRPADAVLLAHTGDLGIREEQWIVLGRQPDYRREEWPIPWFRGVDGWAHVIRRYDDETLRLVEQKKVSAAEAECYPDSGSHGYESLAYTLEQSILAEEAKHLTAMP